MSVIWLKCLLLYGWRDWPDWLHSSIGVCIVCAAFQAISKETCGSTDFAGEVVHAEIFGWTFVLALYDIMIGFNLFNNNFVCGVLLVFLE